ncbi:hypothetical protein Mapa_008467 [Marchantia paleacea]|nr:hypothetical protein Mapa_008467 [Marchantia paleacea]
MGQSRSSQVDEAYQLHQWLVSLVSSKASSSDLQHQQLRFQNSDVTLFPGPSPVTVSHSLPPPPPPPLLADLEAGDAGPVPTPIAALQRPNPPRDYYSLTTTRLLDYIASPLLDFTTAGRRLQLWRDERRAAAGEPDSEWKSKSERVK